MISKAWSRRRIIFVEMGSQLVAFAAALLTSPLSDHGWD